MLQTCCRPLEVGLKLERLWLSSSVDLLLAHYLTRQARIWLCGFSVVAYLENSHSLLFVSFWHLHKVYFRSNKGVTIRFERASVILLLIVLGFFFFALGKWFGVLHLLLQLSAVLPRVASFLSSEMRHFHFRAPSSVSDGCFVTTDKDFLSGSSPKSGPVCEEVATQTHQRGR